MRKKLPPASLIRDIAEKRLPCLFVSPHLDDAVLSCGAVLAFLASKTDVTVATVFTHAQTRLQNASIRRFLRSSGYHNSEKLYVDRREEDRAIHALIGVKTVHLGFTDALYRLKPSVGTFERLVGKIIPDILFVYPVFSWQLKIGKMRRCDEHIVDDVTSAVKKLAGKKTVLFAPAAIGNHMDHQLVRNACAENFPWTIFWSDFPYNVRLNSFAPPELVRKGYTTVEWKDSLDRKVALVKKIRTQVNFLFPNGQIPQVSEYYFWPQR